MIEVDNYIAKFPKDVAAALQAVRKIILKVAPEVSESISYGMPGYKLNGKPLVYFAGYNKHIGFYATPSGHSKYVKELSKYKQGKGSVQFPIDQPIPLDLIKRIVQFRVGETEVKLIKANERTCSNGHKYFKSSDCPTCPICEKSQKPKDTFLSEFAAPARRALENSGITTVKKLSQFTQKQILELHGIGKSSLPKLNKVLQDKGLKFKSE